MKTRLALYLGGLLASIVLSASAASAQTKTAKDASPEPVAYNDALPADMALPKGEAPGAVIEPAQPVQAVKKKASVYDKIRARRGIKEETGKSSSAFDPMKIAPGMAP